MASSKNPNVIPDSYHRVTPCLAVQGGDDARKLQRSPENQFYGDRDAYIVDPFGHGWTVAYARRGRGPGRADAADGRAAGGSEAAVKYVLLFVETRRSSRPSWTR